MEEGVVPLSTILATSAEGIMELDYMDELLLEGCWLEANGSDFPDPISPFEPSFPPPLLEASTADADADTATELSKRWWFGPTATISVMDRLVQALGYIKECSAAGGALVQVWVPVTREGRRVLTTCEQPFSLDLNCPRLAHYREISVRFQFPAEEGESGEAVGLPGRVFRSKVPEWTPDVRFFTRDEYPRVHHAQQVDVRGTVAVPVLEQGSRNCLGVIEVVLTTQKLEYRPELHTVCMALEAVDLRSAQVFITHNVKTTCDLSYEAALPEIREVLKAACMAHHLPLAQTWVPCILQGKGGCRHSEENLQNCVSPVDSACYIRDTGMQGFHEACSDYHLLKGQGIVGRAFRTNEPCFSPDITSCSRTEYPLSHHARVFGLKAAVSIRLRSTCTGSADFVLEMFLPINCMAMEEQKQMLTSLSTIIQKVCRTLRVVSDKEVLEQESPDISSTESLPAPPRQSVSGDGRSVEARERRRAKSITLQVLQQHFAGSLKDAARKLGVCPTTLKRICRQHGLQRWPSRTIKKVGHSLQKIQRVIDSVEGVTLYSNFPELASRNKSSDRRLSSHKQQQNNALRSSSGSQSSNSSQCCSSEAQPSSVSFRSDPGLVKRTRTESNLLNPEVVSVSELDNDLREEEVGNMVRMKVSYGEDNIRFRLRSDIKYRELVLQISRRFAVDDPSSFHLKYLDDDAEWVLLTCDADLEECIHVSRSSGTNTIKLSWHAPAGRRPGYDSIMRGKSYT